MTDVPWCAAASLARREPLRATASRVQRWLLVEHDTAWGPSAVPEALAHLAPTAAAAGARLLAIRRPGRTDTSGHRVFSVESRPGLESVAAQQVPDLSAVVWGAGSPYGRPLYLVCTHGRHDRCCALLGRPVAAALEEVHGDAVWECSHLGGDRFAGNVLVLPEGHYLGRVTPEEAASAVRDLPVGLHRGRSSLPSPVQAAQSFAREALGLESVPDLLEQTTVERDVWSVRLAAGVEVVVRYVRTGHAHLLTCDADEAKAAPSFELVSLTSSLNA